MLIGKSSKNGYKWAIDLLFKELRVSATFKVPQHSLAGHF